MRSLLLDRLHCLHFRKVCTLTGSWSGFQSSSFLAFPRNESSLEIFLSEPYGNGKASYSQGWVSLNALALATNSALLAENPTLLTAQVRS